MRGTAGAGRAGEAKGGGVKITHTQQVDEEHKRYFLHLKDIDPEFTSSITHFIVLDTRR